MKAWMLMLLALAMPVVAMAEEGGEKEDPNKVSYVALAPPLVGNYALDGSPKLHVYKADVALRVTGADAQKLVKTNEPLIRNQLVALFTQQTVDSMSNVDAKEKLRQEALKQTQEVLTQETGKPVVEDLLFNNFIAQ